MDKSYYDYDYSAPKPVAKVKTYDESVKSDDELKSILGRFGWGKPKDRTPVTPEEVQQAAMAVAAQKSESNKISNHD